MNISLKALLGILMSGVSLIGCATVFSGTDQPIQVSTVNRATGETLDNSVCKMTLANGEDLYSGSSSQLLTPGNMTVPRSSKTIVVNCLSSDKKYQGTANVISYYNSTNLWNIGLIFPYVVPAAVGWSLDGISGADFEYPHSVNVVMTPVGESAPVTYINKYSGNKVFFNKQGS